MLEEVEMTSKDILPGYTRIPKPTRLFQFVKAKDVKKFEIVSIIFAIVNLGLIIRLNCMVSELQTGDYSANSGSISMALGQKNPKTNESDLFRFSSNGTLDDNLQSTLNDTGTALTNLTTTTTLRPWLDDYYSKGVVAAVYLLQLNPKFTYQSCPKRRMWKVTLNAASAGKEYYGYGSEKSDAKKMAAQEAIWDLYEKHFTHVFTDLDEYRELCGI